MTKTELKEKWNVVLDLLYTSMERLKVDTFFRPLTPVKLSEKKETIYLKTAGSKSSVYQNSINNHKEFLSEALIKAFGKEYKLEIVDAEPPDDDDEGGSPIPEEKDYGFNPRYTFESFVQGPNNQLALAACLAIADKGYVKEYNPLFLYSGPGLGKTHLMHAVGQYIIKHFPKKRVMYVSSEAFTNELVTSIQEKSTDKFRNKYRKVDVLLFDDVQFISGKAATQEELFHTFNSLFNARKQIVMTSDCPPHAINRLDKRLCSRFEWGLTTEILPPDLETRIAIIRKKQEEQSVKLSDDVINYLAAHLKSSVRRLEGAVFNLVSHASLTKQTVTIEVAEKVLSNIFLEESDTQVTVEHIQRLVAEHYDIRLADMTSKRRPASVAWPRQIAMYFARRLTDLSFPDIANEFDRTHATVLHAVTTVEKKLASDQNFKREMSMLERKLKS